MEMGRDEFVFLFLSFCWGVGGSNRGYLTQLYSSLMVFLAAPKQLLTAKNTGKLIKVEINLNYGTSLTLYFHVDTSSIGVTDTEMKMGAGGRAMYETSPGISFNWGWFLSLLSIKSLPLSII